MKKYFALLLALCMIFALAACSSPKAAQNTDGTANETANETTNETTNETAPETAPEAKTVVGTWEGSISIADVAGEEIPEGYEAFKSINLDMVLELKSDNSFSIAIDGEKAKPAMREAMASIVNTMLEQQGMTPEQFEEASGQTVDSLIEEGMAELDFSDLTYSGTYTEENGKLLLNREDKDPMEGTWAEDTLSLDLEGVKVDFTRK